MTLISHYIRACRKKIFFVIILLCTFTATHNNEVINLTCITDFLCMIASLVLQTLFTLSSSFCNLHENIHMQKDMGIHHSLGIQTNAFMSVYIALPLTTTFSNAPPPQNRNVSVELRRLYNFQQQTPGHYFDSTSYNCSYYTSIQL